MSLYKDASLVMLPSAVKDGKLYSIRPTDGDGDFTFNRGSNLAATRVDVNGLIEKGRENVGLYSADQTNWSIQVETSVTANVAANPINGIVNADKVIPSVASADHYRGRSMAGMSGVITASIYIKADGYNIFDFGIFNANAALYPVRAVFDLSDESITFISGSIATINSVGGDWYRVSLTTSTSSGSMHLYHRVRSTGTSGSYSGNGTSGMLLFGAQLEQGLVATDYIETGASTAQAGILEDLPRLDYSGGASCPSLLLEPQRTNLLPYSEYFSGWNNIQCTLTQNYGVSPDGSNNSTRCVFSSSNRALEYLVSSSAVTASIYIKGTSGETIQFGTNGAEEVFTLNGDWQRLEKFNAASIVRVTLNTYGGATARDFELYGAQLEAGSYPTSYIPTYGSAVTRSEDVCIKTQTFNDIKHNDVTLFYDFDHLGDLPAGQNQFVAYFGSGKYLNIAQYDANVYYVDTDINGSYFFAVAFAATEGRKKVAIKIDGFSWKVFFNGSKIVDTTLTQQSTNAMTEIILSGGTASRPSFQSVHQALAFPTALTDSECIALTTI